MHTYARPIHGSFALKTHRRIRLPVHGRSYSRMQMQKKHSAIKMTEREKEEKSVRSDILSCTILSSVVVDLSTGAIVTYETRIDRSTRADGQCINRDRDRRIRSTARTRAVLLQSDSPFDDRICEKSLSRTTLRRQCLSLTVIPLSGISFLDIHLSHFSLLLIMCTENSRLEVSSGEHRNKAPRSKLKQYIVTYRATSCNRREQKGNYAL